MYHSQTWALSQEANKSNGACSTCFAVRQLHLKDGTVHQHGPRGNPCPGSKKPPLVKAAISSSQPVPLSSSSTVSSASENNSALLNSPADTSSSFSHPSLDGPLVKHIPKSARHACSVALSTILKRISRSSIDLSAWSDLLNFGNTILRKPARGGKRQNLTSLIKKRLEGTSDSLTHVIDKIRSSNRSDSAFLSAAVTAKVEDGNIKAAIRLLCSEDKPAPDTTDTLAKLAEKHPQSSTDINLLPDPKSTSSIQVTEENVLKAMKSFPAGSAGGPDGIRPQHLLDLVCCKESGPALLKSLTDFTNSLLDGNCHADVVPILFGGNLIALEKKTGGIRPIAIGYTWRRIASKCANTYACAQVKEFLAPLQLGVAVSGGCEAAVHATRRYVESMPPDHAIVKLDFSNAFNSVHRSAMLQSVATAVPDIYKFCYLSYSGSTYLKFGTNCVLSQEGAQQGDPLGPLLFCLAIHPMLTSLSSQLVLGYLDDITLGGNETQLELDVQKVRSQGELLGLKLNESKCEFANYQGTPSSEFFTNFIHLFPSNTSLLGAPLTTGIAMDHALQERCNDLRRVIDRLKLVSAHDALIILRSSFSTPKILHTLRSSPCALHPALQTFDDLLKLGITEVTNLDLSEDHWSQASLPVKDGGLGIRRAVSLAPSAFLASAANTLNLQELILANSMTTLQDSAVTRLRQWWTTTFNSACPSHPLSLKQSAWDRPAIDATKMALTNSASDNHHRARLLATAAPHSGDWLHALPISNCGLRLDNESIRVAVGLRLGVNLCQPHECPCGVIVDSRGTHGLSCRRSSGRIARHHHINDIVWRGLTRASIPSSKEPSGLSRTDGKRPDGLTLIPWQGGKSLIWDVTVADTLAASHLPHSSRAASGAADKAAEKKEDKYEALKANYLFVPIACETMGPINVKAFNFLSELGRRISVATGDLREGRFLLQRLSIAIQRFNSVCFQGSFVCADDSPD